MTDQTDAEKIESLTKLHDEDKIVITSQALRIKSIEQECERLKQRLAAAEWPAPPTGPSSGPIESGQYWQGKTTGQGIFVVDFRQAVGEEPAAVSFYHAREPDETRQMSLAHFLATYQRSA